MFFNANILPHLDYCTIIWRNSPHINKLLKASRRAACIILGVRGFQIPSSAIKRQSDIQKNLYMIYKSLNGLAPVYMS